MTENLVTITCNKCQARLKIKPNVFKIMKNLRCTKCGNGILLAPFAEAAREAASAAAAPATAEAVTPPPAPVEPPKSTPAPTPEPASAPSAPSVPPPVTLAPPPPPPPTPRESPSEIAALKTELTQLADENAGLKAEIETLSKKLKKAEFELGESDARVASLQELWHSKEMETREMSARANKAEQEAKTATSQRDAFLARIKDELSMHLLKERDAALTRFAELEKKLLSLPPEAP